MRFLNVKIQDIAGNTIAERDFEISKHRMFYVPAMGKYIINHCTGDQKAIITETIIDSADCDPFSELPDVFTEEDNV